MSGLPYNSANSPMDCQASTAQYVVKDQNTSLFA